MSSKGAFLLGISALSLAFAGTVMAACVGDVPNDASPPASQNDASTSDAPAPNVPKTNGLPCASANECQSGQCSDGVCCDAKCDGICEKCNLPSTVGTCSPIPDGTDPDKECLPAPLPDGGAPAPEDAGADDAGDGGDAGGGDGADGGPPAPSFDLPDGGYPATTADACAGRCNGKRACSYPGAETSCGPSFCGNPAQEARAICDGQGHCGYSVDNCTAYACPSGAAGCRTKCAAPEDCLDTHFCEGTTGECKSRLATGVSCTRGIECQTGYCIDGICCNTACDTSPAGGGSCSTAGKIGQCVCGACPGGTCQLFYRDADDDKFGDVNGTVANGNAKYACEGAPPPGFVADHTDCYDSNLPVAALVHPHQTGWFTSSYVDSLGHDSFDYDCSGNPEKETDDYDHCGVCHIGTFQGVSPGALPPICFISYFGECTASGQQGAHACGCSADNSPFFPYAVDCGKSSSTVQCGTCTGSTGNPPNTNYTSKTQRCH